MTIEFRSSFDTGDLSEFTASVGNVTITTENPPSPPYCARCQTVGTGSDAALERVYVSKSVVTPRNFFYAQMWIRLNQMLPVDGNRISLISMTSGGGAVGSCGVRRSGGVLQWYIIKAATYPAATGPIVGQKHLLEFFQDTITNGLILYIDGVEVMRAPDVSPQNIDAIRFGVAASNIAGVALSVDIDDCAIADAYIGTLPPAVPKLTVRADPEINVPVYVDANFVGNTPITIELAAGTHTVGVEPEVTR